MKTERKRPVRQLFPSNKPRATEQAGVSATKKGRDCEMPRNHFFSSVLDPTFGSLLAFLSYYSSAHSRGKRLSLQELVDLGLIEV